MSWDEKLFGWLYASTARLLAPRADPEQREQRASLSELQGRLRIVASAIAGRAVELGEAEGEGSAHAARLTLPSHIDFAPSRELNERAFVLRVAFGVCALEASVFLPVNATSANQIALATSLAIPLVDRVLDTKLPRARAEREALVHAFVAARGGGGAAEIRDVPGMLEQLVCARLMPAEPGLREQLLEACADPRLSAFGLRALAIEPADLAAELGALIPALRALESSPTLRAADWRGRVRAPQACPLVGWLGRAPSTSRGALTTEELSPEALPSGTEVRGKAREAVVEVKLAQDPSADNPLIHSFEKVQTAEEYSGGSRTPDGSDQLDEHAEALEELDVREIVRSREQAHSLLRSDVMMDASGFDLEGEDDESQGPGVAYDEWDHTKRHYRKHWCVVRTEQLRARFGWADAEARVALMAREGRRAEEAIRAELLRLELSRRWRDRQLDGTEIDVDAMTDRHAALRSGHTPPRHLYRAKRRHAPSLCVMVLVDGSLSTDGWVADRRVLEVEQRACVVLAEALEGLGIELGIAAFRSNTRRDCRFAWIKAPRQPWRQARRRLAALEPAGYTRIGPAIRHATAALGRSEARRRLLLVLTDGKPTDYDRYEGAYGVADVRQAVREAEAEGCRVDALAIDPEARFTLPRMFGASRHHTLRTPDDLPLALGRICSEMRV